MTEPSAEPLILVDGSSYLYRAYHALPPLSTSDGEPTGALYGVANMLRKLVADYHPQHMAVVFDAPGPTFREDLYAEYKANRPPMPDDLSVQVEPLQALVQAMGLPLLVVPGVEADDVIATLARRAEAEGMHVVISTGDKDLAQLVDDAISLVNTMSDTRLDEPGVRERFGVPPERIADYLALVGDTIDNVPGVPKVGPKTAAKWLQQYGSLDEVIAHADEIGGKVGENLRAHLEQLPASRELVEVRQDVALDMSPEALTVGSPDRERLLSLLRRFELRSLVREYETHDAEPAEVAEALDYRAVTTNADLGQWLARLQQAPLMAFDTETTSLNYIDARVVGLSLALEPGHAVYVPLAHHGAEQLDRDAALARLRPLLEDPERPKLGHNLKYDRNVLVNHGIDLAGIRHDTMLESYVLSSTATRHDLDSLAERYLGHRNISYETVAGKGAQQLRFDEVDLEQAVPYACEDADIALRLHRYLWPQLEAQPRQRELYEAIEIPLVPVLSRMECHGVRVDAERLSEQGVELAERMAELEQRAVREAGKVFNLGSPKQIQEILYDQLGLPVLRRTPKGQPSTAEDVLQELALDYPLPRIILDHRSLSKLKSTYIDKLPQQINPATRRVHTSYHQAVASTGRLSSSEPNLQNIPIRTEEGRRIRRAFVAGPGHRIMAADYSQIELRIMAHLSGDPGLLRAFEEDLDIHRATAAEVFAAEPEQVSDEQRRAAKTINFGLMYGMSAYGLGRQLGIDRADADAYIERYFARYPGVKAYMDDIRERARERGYVETVYGRRLYLPEINSRNNQRRQYAERTAINAPMQGTAADIIKRAMIAVDAWLQREAPDALMVMQVHDELVFEVAEEQVAPVREAVVELMIGAAELDVPLAVEAGVGDDWEAAH